MNDELNSTAVAQLAPHRTINLANIINELRSRKLAVRGILLTNRSVVMIFEEQAVHSDSPTTLSYGLYSGFSYDPLSLNPFTVCSLRRRAPSTRAHVWPIESPSKL